VPTFNAFWPRLLDGYARANRQKPGGVAAKETIGRMHVQPHFGLKRLDAIATERVQRLTDTSADPVSVDCEVTPRERAARRALQVPFEAGGSRFVGELDRHREHPRTVFRGRWREAAIVRVEPPHDVGRQADVPPVTSREAAQDVDEPLGHGQGGLQRAGQRERSGLRGFRGNVSGGGKTMRSARHQPW
jgi:hypothetical protein